MEFYIEKIMTHTGDKKTPSRMEFLVKWLNYDESENSWEPWKSLRKTYQLHNYLREHNMQSLIPKEFRNQPSPSEEPSSEEEEVPFEENVVTSLLPQKSLLRMKKRKFRG